MQSDIWARIEQIDWTNLESFVYKNSIPTIFRNLVNDNEQIRKQAITEFIEVFSHQFTLVEALYYALPFLIELVDYEADKLNENILELLAHYAWLTHTSFS